MHHHTQLFFFSFEGLSCHGYVCKCVLVYVCRSKSNLESLLSCHVGPRYGTQVVRLGSKHLYLLSHLVGPIFLASILKVIWELLAEYLFSKHKVQGSILAFYRTGQGVTCL